MTPAEAYAESAIHRDRFAERNKSIVAVILKNPDMTYGAVGQRFGVSAATVRRVADEVGIPKRTSATHGGPSYDML